MRDPLAWRSVNVSESFWSLRSQPRLMNWSRCDDLGLKRFFTRGASKKPKQTLSAWQISPALRAAHIPPEPRAVYHAGETRNQPLCHRGYCNIPWTTLHPINTLQDFRDLIPKAPYRFGKAEMLSQLPPVTQSFHPSCLQPAPCSLKNTRLVPKFSYYRLKTATAHTAYSKFT